MFQANAERLALMHQCERHKQEAASAETELERLEVKLQGAKMIALSSVAAAGGD
jgi:hypothetical protein